MSDGFLGRWARRKEAVRKGEEVPREPEAVVEAKAVVPSPPTSPAGEASEQPPAPPPPSLADAQALTPESDFTRFIQPDVAPEVKNAAMKKLFTDPHFNVMDGLDIYIGDYGKPDPIPPEMLRQLASAKFLNLFDDEEEKEERIEPAAGEAADGPPDETVAQSEARTEQALPLAEHHADPDLRLQQDDAPGRQVPGAGAG
jgi:hypothetical protein